MQLDKLPGESVIDYHKRLVYGKLVDKTLADCDYTELAPYVYGKEYSSDVCRRMLYGSRYTLDLLGDQAVSQIDDSEIIDSIEQKRIELMKEQQKLSDQRREWKKLITSEGRREHLEHKLIEAARALPDTIGDISEIAEPDGDIEFTDLFNDKEAILVFSDWHYGMVANNIYNTYNTEECKRRVNYVVRRTIERIKLHHCTRLHIVVLGDLIHGDCHVSARVASEELACDQIMQSAEILAQAIKWLSANVDETVVHITYGNHARIVQNKADSIHSDNMERFIPWWLEQRILADDMSGNNISVSYAGDGEFLFINACGHEMCAVHGDLDNVKTSPRLLHTLLAKTYGKDIEYVLIGDKHHRESFEEIGVSSMLCGSLCGADDYANEHRLYSRPEQLLLIMDATGLDAEYRIKCDI